MTLLPIDIHNKEFKKGLYGYSQDEVNEFLQEIMNDYDIVLTEKKELEKKLDELQSYVNHYANLEETLNKSIVTAQEAAAEVKHNAIKEADLIVQEAEKNADRIINESLEEARQIRIDKENIKKQANVFRTRLKMLIEAQLDLVDREEWNQFLEEDEKKQKVESAETEETNEAQAQ